MKFRTFLIFLEVILVILVTHSTSGKIRKLFPKSVVNILPPCLYEKVWIKNGSFKFRNNTVESGSFDFFGRDLLYAISKILKTRVGNNSCDKNALGLDAKLKFFKRCYADGLRTYFKVIYPGTKWCGDGTKAKHYDDLGVFKSLDKCCRGHDNCNDFIAAGDIKYGLINKGIFRRSLCECDWEFYNCLKKAENGPASLVGIIYFTVLGPQCFKKDFKKVACVKYKKAKCISYQFDPNSSKTYQWFDSPPF